MYKKPLVGEMPDYSTADLWLARPDDPKLPVDLVYLYPTACTNPFSPLVCAIDDKSMMETAQMYYTAQCSFFEASCNVYAPWYRQVSGTSVFTRSFEEVDEAQWAEPRTCVYAAMDYYFEHLNEGRPWVIAGHSQGSRMLGMVLGDYMLEHPDYYDRMIVAYRIGDGLTRDYLAEYPHVRAAQGADDLGVCVSYNTEGPGNVGHPSLVVPEGCVAINPLNWRTDDVVAGKELCLGSYFTGLNSTEAVPIEERPSTYLDLERGTLVVTNPEMTKYTVDKGAFPLLRPFVRRTFGPESYHNCDYSFFMDNLLENVNVRIKSWFEAHPA